MLGVDQIRGGAIVKSFLTISFVVYKRFLKSSIQVLG